MATARLARSDGREHVLREGNCIVAAGDGQLAAAIVLGPGDDSPEGANLAGADLRRLLAEIAVSIRREAGALEDPAALPDWISVGAESLEGMAYALCESVRLRTGRPAAVVLRDLDLGSCSVIALSRAADRRHLGAAISAESAAGRAAAGEIPIVATSVHELLGYAPSERRRRAEQGIAFPLQDARQGIGALVVFGPADALDPASSEWLTWVAVDAGPRLAAAQHVRKAEARAQTDDLTALPNRRALERAIKAGEGGRGALLMVDLDLFKRVNDGFGHAAGDAVLKHVARIFKRSLRENDVAARVGGEEFALWLPETPLDQALDVADRIRRTVEGSVLHWGGADLKLTCSVGVSAIPETVTHPDNLLPTADAALYQAKAAGRNRVEVAKSGPT
jgi:diguanylate cyclase (GGDEF)-like protein